MDAEQNYGILGQYAGDAWGAGPGWAEIPKRWRALPLVQGDGSIGRGSRRHPNAGRRILLVYRGRAAARRDSPGSLGMRLAIDTHLPRCRAAPAPPQPGPQRDRLRISGGAPTAPNSATLQVTPEYNRHDARSIRRPAMTWGGFPAGRS